MKTLKTTFILSFALILGSVSANAYVGGHGDHVHSKKTVYLTTSPVNFNETETESATEDVKFTNEEVEKYGRALLRQKVARLLKLLPVQEEEQEGGVEI